MTRTITIPNDHKEDVPAWVNKPPKEGWTRRFYGENIHGEQMFLEVSPKRLQFTHGDCGWESYEFTAPNGEYVNYKVFENSARYLAEHHPWGLPAAFKEGKLWPFPLVLEKSEYVFLAAGMSMGIELVKTAQMMEEAKKRETPVKLAPNKSRKTSAKS